MSRGGERGFDETPARWIATLARSLHLATKAATEVTAVQRRRLARSALDCGNFSCRFCGQFDGPCCEAEKSRGCRRRLDRHRDLTPPPLPEPQNAERRARQMAEHDRRPDVMRLKTAHR